MARLRLFEVFEVSTTFFLDVDMTLSVIGENVRSLNIATGQCKSIKTT